MAWYGRAELIWMAMAAYFWLPVILRKNVKLTLLCLSVFLLSTVSLPDPFTSAYVQDNIEGVGSISEHAQDHH